MSEPYKDGYMQAVDQIGHLMAERDRLSLRVIQLEDEIVGNLQGDLAILADSEHLGADELRQATFHAYQAALARWKALGVER